MKADRVVLDTNVLISAALTRTGPPRRVVDLVRTDNGSLLFSVEPPAIAKIYRPTPKELVFAGKPGSVKQVALPSPSQP